MNEQQHGRILVGILWALCLAAWLLMPGCGASPEVRRDYAAEVVRCVREERLIVDRQGTTEEQDRLDLEALRLECDAALESIGGAP